MENTIEKASISVPDDVFKNPDVQVRWSLTVQQIAWGLIGLAAAAVIGVFILSIIAMFINGTVPDTVVLLGTTVATACVSGLVGFIAGKNSNG